MLGVRLLVADSGFTVRQNQGSGEGGGENGHAQVSQHGREEVVDMSARMAGCSPMITVMG